MLSYIYRLIRNFEQEHGIHPNLLYINPDHADHLKQSMDERLTIQRIAELLQMEMIINYDIVHPHVAWTYTAQHIAV